MATNGSNGSSSSPSKFDTSSTVPLWLDGQEVKLSSTFDVVSPLDHEVLYQCSAAGEEDALRAIDSAEKAFKTWSKTKPHTRRDIFLKAAEGFRKRRDEQFHYSHTETGAAESMFAFEHNQAYEACKSVAGLIQVATTSSMPVVSEEGSNALLLKEPYGVVLGIAPWNAPHILGVRACLQPLAMGNTVILKGPEAAPATYWSIASILHEAGLPAGCLNTIYHRTTDAAKVTNTLISHPAVKKINFTGSSAVGSIVASLAGKHLKPTVMELGGKAPSIICEDTNIEAAALQCALGAFLHGGQICMATERILVNAKIADQFRSALQATMEKVFSEQGMGVPQLVTAAPVEKNKKLLSDALSKGASTLYGDPNHNESSKTKMRPVIIENVKPGMDIYHTESFGPTVSLFVVGSDEEAIEIANDTDYGLSSAVFTEDLRRGLRIARQIESGAVHINSMTVHDEVALPHGGVKKSGFGRFNSLQGLDEWAWTKVVTWKD
ncbi:NAD-dependent aldehyde dehydrogenase [Capronia epimyces CBS 606.96]|uniref:NAD-dependent aldehyde dehydrogenase n=1 Tax=Capronia epimyces CBS 606.96 TaxID=1182542 RepID=W9Y642_9EURO|nr:NAD-dependent aldehyde dehydrogenase [Capronia epimyces CBS 606.96]EXJ85105.1 NAD-dependent aldehyde dehydrogenase [Capronia epimyces CBS 606.96]